MVIIMKKYNWRPHVRFIYWDLPPHVRLYRGFTLKRRMSYLMTKITTTKTLSLGNNQWDLTTSGNSCFYTATIQLSVQPDLLCSWSFDVYHFIGSFWALPINFLISSSLPSELIFQKWNRNCFIFIFISSKWMIQMKVQCMR